MTAHWLGVAMTTFAAVPRPAAPHHGFWASTAPLLPFLILGVAFFVFCLIDLARTEAVRYLPKWAWAAICLVSIPLGGIIYLSVGKAPRADRIAASPDQPRQLPPYVRRSPTSPSRDDAARMIEVDRLTKRFGPLVALDGLSFVVRPGRVTGFLGPNGAGKSTAMRTILGLDAPTGGRAVVGGRAYRDLVRPLHQVGSLLDANALHPGRSAWHHLRSAAQANGIRTRRVEEVLQLTGIDAVARRAVRTFSLGMKQRLGIALALLGDPPVLVFDEPANGLDPEGIHWIRQLFTSLAAEGRTVFISSHLMSEMALTADHLIIIGQGRVLADTPINQFIEVDAHSDVLVRSPQADVLAGLLAARGATVTAAPEHGLAVAGIDAPSIANLAAEHSIPVHELTPRHATLEQAYLRLTETSLDYRAGTA